MTRVEWLEWLVPDTLFSVETAGHMLSLHDNGTLHVWPRAVLVRRLLQAVERYESQVPG